MDSGIGVYAGSPDSYVAFADLFDKIIEDYHGHKPADKHVSDMDASHLKAPPFEPHEAAMIKSTRIRIARNYEDVRLGPGISKEDRLKLVHRFENVARNFTGDLAGKFYSLETMSAADQQKLIDDHFLFKEGDRFLEACGLNRDWPSGRGIYHNNEKTFLVWINEEDELRIISMQNGADIGAVFERLCRASALLQGAERFARNDHLGFITSCPTNCGTGLRASVHIKLPNLGAKKETFNMIADKYNVQIRGIHGEHSESADHVYDISNRRRLGISEVDLVQDMYNGVKAMIAKELELAKENTPAPKQEEETLCGAHLGKAEDLVGFPKFPPGTKSILSKYLTRDIWNKFKDAKDKFGVSFKQCVFSGC